MRKTIPSLLAVIMLTFGYCFLSLNPVSAQDFHFRMGEQTNKKAYNASLIHIAEGMQETQLLVVEPILKAVSGPLSNPVKAIKVRLCDMDWNDSKSVTLDNSKKNTVHDAFRIGNRLHVLLGANEEKSLILRHVTLDAQSLDIVGDSPLVDSPLPKGCESFLWTVCSPNGQYRGVVYAIWDDNSNSKAVAMMFDREMNKLWERRLAYSDVFNVIATDEGAIVTLRLGMVEDNESLTAFRINMATASGEKHGEYVLDADVSDPALVGCDGSRVLALTLEGKGGYGAIRFGSLGGRDYSGIYGLVFDLDQQKITVANRHPFTDEELRILANDDKGQTYSQREITFMRKLDDCQTAAGGAALYQHAWSLETRNIRTGMTSTTVYSQGILLVQATMDGNLTIKGIPQNNQNANWPPVGADLLVHGGNLYIVTNESKEASDIYTPDEPALRSKSLVFANTALAVYWFTPDGKGAKKVVEKDRKAVLATPLAGDGDRFYFLTMGGIYPYISSLTLPSAR